MANNLKHLDGNQVLRSVYDVDSNRLRTDAVINVDIGGVEVVIDQDTDSIRIGDGTDLVTATTVGADVGLDVNIINNDLDIRNLNASQDNVAISDGSNTVSINSDGSINAIALNKLIDVKYDEVEVTQFTSDGDPEIIQFKSASMVQRTLTITYNSDGDFQRVVRS
jgi:hypothetical protein